MIMKTNPFGQAFLDFLEGKETAEVLVHCNKGDDEIIPVSYFFREFEKMPLLEKKALDLCFGKILDIGAGSGIHSLELVRRGFEVCSLDINPAFGEVMRKRGLRNVIVSDIFDFRNEKFDTLLMMMNGIGFTRNFDGLSQFLKQAKVLLKPGGQLILDSSDLLYLYEEEDGSYAINLNDDYYGEVIYKVEYNDETGDPFPWLYIDYDNLSLIAENSGFRCEKIFEDDHYNYLARLY